MNQLLFFILGLIIGSLSAITFMCMLFISKSSDEIIDLEKENIKWKKEKEI